MLCTDNDVYVEFDYSDFCVKDHQSKVAKLQGIRVYELYKLDGSPISNLFTSVKRAVDKYADSSYCITKECSKESFCIVCKLAKSHKLSFNSSHIRATQSFHFLFLDPWTTPKAMNTDVKYFFQ